MGDRSPKDKQKKQKQHKQELNQKQQHRQENMQKNRHNTAEQPGADKEDAGQEQYKRAG